MWILKKINNNCALARDDDGQDLVVFGKGIAYRRPPYELKDLSIVERTFYGVGGASVAALKDIPSDVLLLAADIVDYASAKLDTEFNPNAPVTLADHINFACQRVSQGVVIETPLSFDVMRLYPREVAVARRALTLAKSRLGVALPEAEVTNIALHLIDGESEQSNMEATIEATRVLEDLTEIVVRHIGALDTSSFTYARFAMHVFARPYQAGGGRGCRLWNDASRYEGDVSGVVCLYGRYSRLLYFRARLGMQRERDTLPADACSAT